MSAFQPIPFTDLVRRVFYEYRTFGKIFGMPQEKFFRSVPGVNLSVDYIGRRASTPFGPAAGPHTQLAQNLVLAWLTGSRILELKTIQILDQLELPRPCIDTENLGFNVEWSQELPLEVSLREYVKAWMLIEMITSSELLGEEFSKHFSDTIFDLSLGYDLKGIKSDKLHAYIRGLQDATATIDALRNDIPAEYSRFRDLNYNPHIIDSVTLSTFHGCPSEEIDQIISYLLTEHQVNVIVKLNPTLLGHDEVSHILYDVLGYQDIELHSEAFAQDLQFDQAVELIRHKHQIAVSGRKRLGLKLTNTLVVKNHKGYFADDVMYLSGPPLHVLALRLLKRVRDALGSLHPYILTSFSAGVDAKNIADTLSLKLAPVTVCTDMLKVPGYEKSPEYLHTIAEKIEAAGAINVSDFILKRFDHAVAAIGDVFDALRQEVTQTGSPSAQDQVQVFDSLQERLLNALKENNDSLELLTTDALIVTRTLERYRRAHSDRQHKENSLCPRSFKELYDHILSAAAQRNLDTVLYQAMLEPRYTAEKNSTVPKKLPGELEFYDCTSCGRCVSVCPNNANFVYYSKPTNISYNNYTLTGEGLTESEGGAFTLKRFYQIANFDDCCNQCSLCGIHCVETGQPYKAKPKYFGSRERWTANHETDGFFLEKIENYESILGRIDGQEYTLTFDSEANQVTFGDGVLEAIFDYPSHTLINTISLATQQLGHVLDMRVYHILLTQLHGILNQENCNYVNIKYYYEYARELLDIRGIITVLTTPFTAQNHVDLEALRTHVRQALTAGVAGFLVPPMANEVEKLSEEERKQVVQTVLEELNQRVPLIGDASAATLEARLHHARTLIELGCDGVLVNIPYSDDEQYIREVREIAALNPGFLMLRDGDARGYGVPVKLIQQLFYEIDVFRALKIDVVPAGPRYTQILEATKGQLHVSGGRAVMQMLEALDRGVHAFMPAGMHDIYTTLYTLHQNGDQAASRELFHKLLPILAFANQHPDIATQFCKRLLYKQGVYPTPHVRNPRFPFDPVHEAIADDLIEQVQEIIVSLREE